MARRPWFKHFSNASDGATLKTLWATDLAAYGLFWRLLEMLARFEDENNPGTMTISAKVICRELDWRMPRLELNMARITAGSQVSYERLPDQVWRVKFPNWTKLQSSWGGKRGARFEQDPGRSKKLEVRSKNIEKKAQTSSAQDTHQLVQDRKRQEFEPEFLKAYAKYPLKKGKQRAYRIFMREALDHEENLSLLMTAIGRYQSDLVKNKTEPKFIKHFDTFLSSWRDWLDDDAGKAEVKTERRGIVIGKPNEF